MLYDKFVISKIPPETISGQIQRSHNSVWLGAMSGEDRCSASVSSFAQFKLQFTYGFLIDYEAELEQPPDAKQAVSRQRDLLTNMGHSLFRQQIRTRPISPYSFQDFEVLLENILKEYSPDFMLFDITCFTKIHLLALAAALSRNISLSAWAAVYTKPEAYLALEHAPGWRDIIIASLGDTGILLNEAFSRGIILPGHEGDRLVVAMSEVEASVE